MGGSAVGVWAPVGGASGVGVGDVDDDVVVVGRRAGDGVASTARGASCTAAMAVGAGGKGGYTGVGSESTSTLVYDVRALADK